MWIADKYIDYVKEQTAAHPGQSWDQMLLGFKLNKLRTKVLPKKGISKGYQKLESMMMSFVADSLGRPDRYVWAIIFHPVRSSGVSDLTHSLSSVFPAISAGIIWKISLSTMRRIRELRRPCVPTTRHLWEPLTAARCRCRSMP